ncbi:MAG: HAMP domain-containing histidine kinase [Deltaproteobacteria bacterium]|nr:HAMP domain-containing histidine kinase [Deltaproteobacteria bacterium]MBI4795099.1 HAMP domain-containing histidine kinase [Deltaproteobacteria bacterium]
MTAWKINLHLNIRQKVAVGLTACILAIGFIGGLSYNYLRQIETKQHFVEIADDLSNTILEIRRYEKNYLLYGSAEDWQENRRYIQLGLETLDKIAPEVKYLKIAPQFPLFREEFLAYSRLMEELPKSAASRSRVEEQLRERGKTLVELSLHLVKFERQRILEIINTLKTQLLSSMLVFLGFMGFFVLIVSRKIIRPLRVIEDTTLRIAQGNFRPLPVLDTRDETQRVVEAFNRMVAELEKRQDQLVQAKKMSSLGVLTAGIAHQLNNPLNNISTSCQIILEDLDQCDRELLKKMLTNVEQEVYRARDIVKGLLEFSRERDFELKPIPLEDVVNRSIRLISSQVPPGIDIVQEVPWDLVLKIDAQRLQEVFLNLLMNAVQAIKEPPGEIKIAAQVDAGNRQAVITIEDTGVGIPREEIDRVFDPFFTTKEVGAGTGLGLSIVYGIIEKHQGSITVESKEGEGTRFVIRLPYNSLDKEKRPSP